MVRCGAGATGTRITAGRLVGRTGLLLLSLTGAFACTEPGAPTFSFHNQVVFGVRTLPTEVTPGDRTLVVTGMLITPETRFAVSGTLASPASRALLMTVTGVRTDVSDPRYPDRNYYIGNIGGLGSGLYDVKVLEVIGADQPDTTVVFDATVRVR